MHWAGLTVYSRPPGPSRDSGSPLVSRFTVVSPDTDHAVSWGSGGTRGTWKTPVARDTIATGSPVDSWSALNNKSSVIIIIIIIKRFWQCKSGREWLDKISVRRPQSHKTNA